MEDDPGEVTKWVSCKWVLFKPSVSTSPTILSGELLANDVDDDERRETEDGGGGNGVGTVECELLWSTFEDSIWFAMSIRSKIKPKVFSYAALSCVCP